MQLNNKNSILVQIALLMVLGGLSQSVWWNSPPLVQQDGLGWVIFVLGTSIVFVVGLIYQAERLLVYVYNPFGVCAGASPHPPRHSSIFYILLFSMFVGGVVLASHHLLVSSWQSSINFGLFGYGTSFPSFSLVVANQQYLTGSLGKQLVWLLFSLIGVTSIVLMFTLRVELVWLLATVVVAVVVVFAWMFSRQFAFNLLPHKLPDASLNPASGIRLALDTSLAGFGLIFGLCRWHGHAARAGWLVAAMVLLALVYAVHILGAWQFASSTWVSVVPTSDRLLLHIPYVLLQSQSYLLYWLWFALGCLLSWIKIALILSFAALIISRFAKVSLISTHLVVTLLTGLLTLCWLLIGYFGRDSEEEAITMLFKVLFGGVLYWWYPLHLILLSTLAFKVSVEEHMIYAWRNNHLLGMVLKYSYLGVIALLLWYIFFR